MHFCYRIESLLSIKLSATLCVGRIYNYVCVCVCVCVYVYVGQMPVCAYIYVCVCTYVCVCLCVFASVPTCVYIVYVNVWHCSGLSLVCHMVCFFAFYVSRPVSFVSKVATCQKRVMKKNPIINRILIDHPTADTSGSLGWLVNGSGTGASPRRLG